MGIRTLRHINRLNIYGSYMVIDEELHALQQTLAWEQVQCFGKSIEFYSFWPERARVEGRQSRSQLRSYGVLVVTFSEDLDPTLTPHHGQPPKSCILK